MGNGPGAGAWLMLIYKIPREPAAGRVYVWRKLKQLGAILLQDAVWVMPATPQTRHHLQWLASEISEYGGEATVWLSELESRESEADLIRQFDTQVEPVYREILRQLKLKRPDLATLSRQYQTASAKDFFASKLGRQARAALLTAERNPEN